MSNNPVNFWTGVTWQGAAETTMVGYLVNAWGEKIKLTGIRSEDGRIEWNGIATKGIQT